MAKETRKCWESIQFTGKPKQRELENGSQSENKYTPNNGRNKKTLRIDCDQCILCGNTNSWSHYIHNHLRWYEKSKIRDRICNQIIKKDNLNDENKLKWTLEEGATLKTLLATGIISQTTVKMIK
jgi:hypothetical protein